MTFSLLLLFWLSVYSANGQRKVLSTLIPFYFFARNPSHNSTVCGILFFLWFTKAPNNNSVALLPFLYYKSLNLRLVGCLIVWVARTTAGVLRVIILPLFYLKHDNTSTRVILFPLFYYHRSTTPHHRSSVGKKKCSHLSSS